MHQRFQINPEAVANRMGDQVVLVHIGTDRIFELNSTAARIWDLLSLGNSREEIQKQIREEFQISDVLAAQQTEELLSSLIEERIISVGNDDRPE
jgi:hypothetical protein